MAARRLTSAFAVGLALASVPAGCLGTGGGKVTAPSKSADSATGAAASRGLTVPRLVESCALTVDEIKAAIGVAPSAPGRGTPLQCTYQVPVAAGVTLYELRVNSTVTNPGVLQIERQNAGERAIVELKDVGRGAFVIKADPASKHVPGFVMTNSGYAIVDSVPAGEPGPDDTKAVVALVRALAKKLDVPPTSSTVDPGAPAAT